jgi:hypothetical protein
VRTDSPIYSALHGDTFDQDRSVWRTQSVDLS